MKTFRFFKKILRLRQILKDDAMLEKEVKEKKKRLEKEALEEKEAGRDYNDCTWNSVYHCEICDYMIDRSGHHLSHPDWARLNYIGKLKITIDEIYKKYEELKLCEPANLAQLFYDLKVNGDRVLSTEDKYIKLNDAVIQALTSIDERLKKLENRLIQNPYSIPLQ